MKHRTWSNWSSLLVLAFLALPMASLAGQTDAQRREYREQEREVARALKIAQEHALQAHQEGAIAVERAYRAAQEHAEQARLQNVAEREFALQRVQEHAQRIREDRERVLREVREGQRERIRDLQQVVVRLRARVRLGVSLDADQDGEYENQGARVTDVLEDSPAEAAGIREGDIITHLNGHSLLSPLPEEEDEDFEDASSLPVQRLIALAGELEDGETVEVRYLRDGDAATVSVTAAEMESNWVTYRSREPGRGVYRIAPRTFHFQGPDVDDIRIEVLPKLEGLRGEMEDLAIELKGLEGLEDFHFDKGGVWTFRNGPDVSFFSPRGQFFRQGGGGDYSFFRGDNNLALTFRGGAHVHGLELRKLNPDLGEYFSASAGVLVMEVDEDSTLGLQAGDVILSIGNRNVEDTRDVFRILGSYEEDEAVTFTVMRKGQETRVEGTMG